ncbi:MAG: type IV pili twitching motility protein PilT, partial [Rhodanobacteraceae bacterium]
MLELTAFMQMMASKKASDCFFSVGAPPSIKIEGVTTHLGDTSLTGEEVRTMAYSIMNDKQQKEYETTLEMNLAIGLPDFGRFRV